MRQRAGFTLVEVLVSVSVTLLLMTAVYSAIDLHWRYQTAGQLERERGRIARAVLQRIALDIRSVQFAPPKAEEEESDEDSEEGGDGGEIELTNPDDALLLQSAGVVGTSNRLTLHVSKPLPSRAFRTAANGQDVGLFHSDQLSVAWFLADHNGDELASMVAARIEGAPPVGVVLLLQQRTGDGPLGLARTESDRFQTVEAEAEGDMATLADAAEFLAPEINSLAFRYFDGIDWQEEWDSTAMGALPTAIEITIGFVPPADDDPLRSEADGTIPDFYRYVVAVPLAETIVSDYDY